MTKNIALLICASLLILLITSLVRVENERYALSIGMCIHPQLLNADNQCLVNVQTRNGWWWHVFYAITN